MSLKLDPLDLFPNGNPKGSSVEDRTTMDTRGGERVSPLVDTEINPTRVHHGIKLISELIQNPGMIKQMRYIEDDINNGIATQEPSGVDTPYLSMLIQAGIPEDEANKRARDSAIIGWKLRRVEALLASGYLNAIRQGNNPLEIPGFKEAMPIYKQQFLDMLVFLGISPEMPSQLDPDMSIIDSYRTRITPFPSLLQYAILSEDQQGTIFLWGNEGGLKRDPIVGVYFKADVSSKDFVEGAPPIIAHWNDHTKVHEDSHFLAISIKGFSGYSGDRDLAMLGEGFAPIFELWYEGSKSTDNNSFSLETLNSISKGISPVKLRFNDEYTIDQIKFWEEARREGLIKEHSNTINMSSVIMSFLKSNDNIEFQTVFQAFLFSNSLDEFFSKLEIIASRNSFEKFKEEISICIGISQETRFSS